MSRPIVIVVACGLAMAACAPKYVYQPEANATATMKGRVAADYQIPSTTAPQGDVRLASFGMSKIASSKMPDQSQKAVHVRMIVNDNSQAAWTLDTRQQVIVFPGGQQVAPGLVTTREGTAGLPSVTVPAGGKRIVDLFYPLPANLQSASQIPEFDVVWHVNTPEQQVTERTPFDRLRVDPEVAYGYGPEWGIGDGSWGGPWYDTGYYGWGGDVVVGAPHWGGHEGGFGGGHGGFGGGHGGGHGR
ncbi:MAG: uncharacterized protein JWM53_3448 [bacterium]|nr:uncharacterized protein [bacterium]